MKIAIVKETEEKEKRVSASPETVKKLISLGFSVDIEEGAGESSFFSNEDYKNSNGNLELVYKTRKYGIPCERKFEINSNSIVIGFVSNGCF